MTISGNKVTIMGIDPGFATGGVCVVDYDFDKGCFGEPALRLFTSKGETKKDRAKHNIRQTTDDIRRLQEMTDFYTSVFEEFKPDLAGLETFAPRPGQGNGWKAAMGVSVAVSMLHVRGIGTYPFISIDIKKGILGKASGSKEEIIAKLKTQFVLGNLKMAESKLDHVFDALGICILVKNEALKVRKMAGI